MKAKLKTLWQILRQTQQAWSKDNATRLAAALAFYTVLSVAPLLVLAISVVALVFGEDAARGRVAGELASVVGPQAGEGIQTMIQHANSPSGLSIGSIVSIVVLLFGASGVFGELQSSLNAIWQVTPKPGAASWAWCAIGFSRSRWSWAWRSCCWCRSSSAQRSPRRASSLRTCCRVVKRFGKW